MDSLTPVIRPRSWSRGPADPPGSAPVRKPLGPSEATDILTGLERLVVGQQTALRQLSLLLAMHALGSARAHAPNAIVIGPTGVGKTYALSVACRAMGLPFVATDATLLVPSGIVGEQVEDLLEGLVRAADALVSSAPASRRQDDELELAGRGVILIDEFDKLAAPDDDPLWKQAERRGIQRRLLKLAEGANLRVGVKHHEPGTPDRYIDTSGILLIVAGVFDGLYSARWRPGHTAWSLRREGTGVTPSDIVEAGFLPELVGRFPVHIVFDALTAPDLVGIIDHDEASPLTAWRHYFDAAFQASLRLDEPTKWVVAERAAALGLGARGLQHVLFPVLCAKASQLVGAHGGQEVVLRVSDFLPDAASAAIATPLQ